MCECDMTLENYDVTLLCLVTDWCSELNVRIRSSSLTTSSRGMEKWLEKRSIHTMNLRSVFSAEQQRILERYYHIGMTNQSKSCFQLILQCAQETKLDFSVVRTWVGNKRRKLASKADQNGIASSGHSQSGSLLTAEMTAMRSVHPSLPHLLPPQASSSSSSPSSSSPLSGNSDLVLTGIYSLSRGANCLDSSAHARTGTISFPPLPADSELSTRERSDTAEQHTTKAHGSSSLKPFSPRDCLPTLSPPWEKQYRTWPPKPLAPHQSPSKVTVDSGTQILQAFTPDGAGTASRHLHTGDREVRRKRQADSSEISIASATGDVDEYSREEELANLGERMRLGATSTEDGGWSSAAWSASLIGSPGSDGRSQSGAHPEKSCQTSISPDPASFTQPLSATSPKIPCFMQYESMSLRDQLSAHGMAPWLQGQSRKRTLQDRTQFSDRDLYTLKRCWDSGMTSLGSVCREKIAAAALELSVDPEIIKTWIGNRRRKYRLMGIEIPPPKAGPITALGAERDPSSSDGCCESMPNGKSHSAPATLVKTEQSEEEDEDDDDEDMLSTEMEHIQNLLEFKNEEVQFLEKELQNQKQRFSVLENFTKNLLIAVKNNDKKKQLELLDSLPHTQKDWNQECQDTGPSHIT